MSVSRRVAPVFTGAGGPGHDLSTVAPVVRNRHAASVHAWTVQAVSTNPALSTLAVPLDGRRNALSRRLMKRNLSPGSTHTWSSHEIALRQHDSTTVPSS